MADRTVQENLTRDLLAKVLYGDGTDPEWLKTVDGSPNVASYELADRVLALLSTPAGAEALARLLASRHHGEAEVLLANLPEDYDSAETEEAYRQSDLMLKRAQVHATLAALGQ